MTSDIDKLEEAVEATKQEAIDVTERALRVLGHAEDLVNQFDGVVARETMYRTAFDALKFLFYGPGPVRKRDVKAILNATQERIYASYKAELKKLVPDWNEETDDTRHS
jgi:hypothetical protein